MNIRILTEPDAEIFWQMRLRALQEEPEAFLTAYEEDRDTPIEVIEKRFRDATPGNLIFGAFVDNRLIGMAGIFREHKQKTRHKATIWGVYVLPDYRKQGIARHLIETAIRHAREWQGLEQVHLAVVVKNQPAYRLYRALGFVTWGIEPDAMRWQGQALDEAYMVLRL